MMPTYNTTINCGTETTNHYRLERFETRRGERHFLFSTPSRPVIEPIQPPVRWVTQLSPGDNAVGRGVEHLLPFGAEVQIGYSYTSILPLCPQDMLQEELYLISAITENRTQ